ncbi:MAG: glycosyltransferase [Planctomycetaceae bacterium]
MIMKADPSARDETREAVVAPSRHTGLEMLLSGFGGQQQRRETQLASVIVVSFNTRDSTLACLRSLSVHEPHAQVIVVDNASSDGSVTAIAEEFPEITLLRLSQNVGFARACNVAIDAATHDVIVLLSSTAELVDDSLSTCIRELSRRPELGAVTPQLRWADGRSQKTLRALPTFFGRLRQGLHGRQKQTAAGNDWIPRTCMILKKQAINQAGGLFNPLLMMSWEDADLSARLKSAGFQVAVVENTELVDNGRPFGGMADPEAARNQRRNSASSHPHSAEVSRCGHEISDGEPRYLPTPADLNRQAWNTYGQHLWFAEHRPNWEAICFWLLEFVDALRCMADSIVPGQGRQTFRGGWTHLKTLVRYLFGAAPDFPTSETHGRRDFELIIPENGLGAVSPAPELTDVGAVVIGRNNGSRLRRCLMSMAAADIPVVYVDLASTDGSRNLAGYLGITLVEFNADLPGSASHARNAGVNELLKLYPKLNFVQFVDGDSEVIPGWLAAARELLTASSDCGAVCGTLQQRHPETSVYHRLCQLEERRVDGPIGDPGAVFMARVEALRSIGGFDETVTVDEGMDMSMRMSLHNQTVFACAKPMAQHDAAATHFSDWWQQAVQTGRSLAAINDRHGIAVNSVTGLQFRSVIFRGIVAPIVALLGAWPTSGASLLLLAAGYLQLYAKVRDRKLNTGERRSDASLFAKFFLLRTFAEAQGVVLETVSRISSRMNPRLASGLTRTKKPESENSGFSKVGAT